MLQNVPEIEKQTAELKASLQEIIEEVRELQQDREALREELKLDREATRKELIKLRNELNLSEQTILSLKEQVSLNTVSPPTATNLSEPQPSSSLNDTKQPSHADIALLMDSNGKFVNENKLFPGVAVKDLD